MKGPIQSVEATYLVHATEDPGKLERALAGIFGNASAPSLERLEGHFGNVILSARLHLTGDEAEGAFHRMVTMIPEGARKEVMADLPSYLDEHSSLFLRFDKQSLVKGRVALGSADVVRVKVKPRGFMMKGAATGFYRKLFGER